MTDKQKQACEDYIKGMKYADIAAKYEVSVNSVKSWAARYWKKEKVAKVAEKKLQPTPRKKGGQNGNANAVTHGAYRVFDPDDLTDDECAIMDEQSPDLERELIQEINVSTVIEKRLLKQIAKYQAEYKIDDEELNILTGVVRIKGEKDGEIEKRVIKETSPAYLYLRILGEQLSKARAEKSKCIKMLADLREKKRGQDNGEPVKIILERKHGNNS